jgi:hypothetical protein
MVLKPILSLTKVIQINFTNDLYLTGGFSFLCRA